MMQRLIWIIGITVLFSCSNQKKEALSKNIIPPAKMQDVLWDYLRADTYTSDFLKKDSLTNDTLRNLRLQQEIFKHYNITKEDFYNSYHYYISRPAEMTAIVDSMVAKQQRQKTKSNFKEYINQ